MLPPFIFTKLPALSLLVGMMSFPALIRGQASGSAAEFPQTKFKTEGQKTKRGINENELYLYSHDPKLSAATLEFAQSAALIRVALENARKALREAQASGASQERLKDLADLIARLEDMQKRATDRQEQFSKLALSTLEPGERPGNSALPKDPRAWAHIDELSTEAATDTVAVNALSKEIAPEQAAKEAPAQSVSGGGSAGGGPRTPAPPTPPAGVGGGGGGVAPATPSLADREAAWFAQLQQGLLQYHVPDLMYWKHATTVSVAVLGPQALSSSGLAEVTASGSLKVSDRMRIVLSCPENPDEFAIERQSGTDEVQFVPAGSSATWNWTVTPKYTGRSQKLQVSAWVLYPGENDKVLQQLPVYTAKIDVHVPGLGEGLKRLFEGDPDYWLKYGLPGGAGFVFFSGMITGLIKWWRDRKAKAKTAIPAGP